MNYSKDGLALTEQFEGCRLTAYQDAGGRWTIGYGHAGPDVCDGMTVTQDQAERLLLSDVAAAEKAVNDLVHVPLTQGQFNALVDFVFNVGCGTFERSTMLRLLNAGSYSGAAAEFERFSYCGGRKLAGLLRRRTAEADEFRMAN